MRSILSSLRRENTGTPPAASTTELDLDVAFHGAIATTATQKLDRLVQTNGAQDIIPITITAPGLLTVETTGSTDTVGMLDLNPDGAPTGDDEEEVAHAEDGGSGGNFKFVVPVTAETYDVVVEGQTLGTTGDYTLDMDFKVAMAAPTGFDRDEITLPALLFLTGRYGFCRR